jgi:hypothetical protein
MRIKKNRGLDFEIDKLTNSIENVQSGDNFPTDIAYLAKSDLNSLTKVKGWRFNWKAEYKVPEREIY